jgi:hypothetical protein
VLKGVVFAVVVFTVGAGTRGSGVRLVWAIADSIFALHRGQATLVGGGSDLLLLPCALVIFLEWSDGVGVDDCISYLVLARWRYTPHADAATATGGAPFSSAPPSSFFAVEKGVPPLFVLRHWVETGRVVLCFLALGALVDRLVLGDLLEEDMGRNVRATAELATHQFFGFLVEPV